MSGLVSIFEGAPADGNLLSPALTTYGARTRVNNVPFLIYTPGPGEVYELTSIIVSNSSDDFANVSIVVAPVDMTRQQVDSHGNPALRFGNSLQPVGQISWGRGLSPGGGGVAINPGGHKLRGAGPQGTPVARGLWLGAMPGVNIGPSYDGPPALVVSVMAERTA